MKRQRTRGIELLLLLLLVTTACRSTSTEVKEPANSDTQVEGRVSVTSPEMLLLNTPVGDYDVELFRSTRATYAGVTYRIRDLQPGDRVRVAGEGRKSRRIAATHIELIADAPLCETPPTADLARDIRVSGKLAEIDRHNRTFLLTTPTGKTLVDVHVAVDGTGKHLLLDDFRIGDNLLVTGGDHGDHFLARQVIFAPRPSANRQPTGQSE